jgi:glutathione S-transferase
MPTLVMANKNYSSWSVRPWFFLRAAGILFEEKVVGLGTPGFADTIPKLSPSGRVPALVLDDGEVVYDSLAIGEHLAEAYPDKGIWPSDARARRRARAACAEMHAGFADMRHVLTCNLRRRYAPDVWRRVAATPERIAAVEADIARMHALWTSLLDASGGPFLCGSFGFVDAYFVPVVSRFATYGVESSGAASSYRAAIEALPTYRQWLAEAEAEPLTIAKYEYDDVT